MLDIAPPPGGSLPARWDQGASGVEGKWKEGTHSKEGSRVGTPIANAEVGPSMQQRVQPGGPLKSPQAQAQVQASTPRQAYNAQSQQSQRQPLPQSQLQPPQTVFQRQYSDQHPTLTRNSGYGSDVDDVMVIPSSGEEYDNDWKLVSPIQGSSGFMGLGGKGKGEGSKVAFRDMEKKDKGIKTTRRRTALDRSGEGFCLVCSLSFWLLTHLSSPIFFFFFSFLELSPDSTPIMLDNTQSPPTLKTAAKLGVTRSRTLPTRKKGSGDDTLGIGMESSAAVRRVLKKQNRTSGLTPNLNLNPKNVNANTNTDANTDANTNVVNRTW